MLAVLQKMTSYTYLVKLFELNTFFFIDFGELFDMIQLNKNDHSSIMHYSLLISI